MCRLLSNGMRPAHRGEALVGDYVLPKGVGIRAVVLALHVPYSRLCEVIKGARSGYADTVHRLMRYFGREAKNG